MARTVRGGWSSARWRWLAAVLVAGTVSCGSSPGTEADPAERYLDEVLTLIEQNHIHRSEVDWAAYRRQVRAAAAGATTLAALDPALQLAVDLLGDRHSAICRGHGTCLYQSSHGLGGWIGWSDPGALPAGVAYVRVQGNSATALSTRQLADQLQAAVRAQDRDGLVGWIVDLRQNGGGNMWPMLAGIGPVLGDGTAGSFVFPEGMTTPHLAPGASMAWSYSGGAAYFDGRPHTSVTVPYTLRAPARRIAVLQDGGTGSAGEAIAIAFIGRPNARSFGAATYGVSSANWSFSLSDGGVLQLLVALDRDRNGTTYGGSVAPDEQTAGPAETVAAAVTWLTTP
ncbi:MAG: S41 family peptidase [Deltaproteobacteria bacterium]|nr:S41 family peptidase [Deltaproteobacteria bacterium]